MRELLYLSQADVESLLDVDAMLEAIAKALILFSAGVTSVPPRTAARAPDGLMGVMAGYVPGVALEVKLVSVFPGNHGHGVPSHQALIALFDEKDGTPLALMDGTHITAIRTGGTAAVATRALARQDSSVLAILGAGVQGGSHLDTFPHVRNFKDIRVASRDHAKAAALAARHPKARVAASFEEAVRGADVVACCTDAREPVIRRAWLKPWCACQLRRRHLRPRARSRDRGRGQGVRRVARRRDQCAPGRGARAAGARREHDHGGWRGLGGYETGPDL